MVRLAESLPDLSMIMRIWWLSLSITLLACRPSTILELHEMSERRLRYAQRTYLVYGISASWTLAYIRRGIQLRHETNLISSRFALSLKRPLWRPRVCACQCDDPFRTELSRSCLKSIHKSFRHVFHVSYSLTDLRKSIGNSGEIFFRAISGKMRIWSSCTSLRQPALSAP